MWSTSKRKSPRSTDQAAGHWQCRRSDRTRFWPQLIIHMVITTTLSHIICCNKHYPYFIHLPNLIAVCAYSHWKQKPDVSGFVFCPHKKKKIKCNDLRWIRVAAKLQKSDHSKSWITKTFFYLHGISFTFVFLVHRQNIPWRVLFRHSHAQVNESTPLRLALAVSEGRVRRWMLCLDREQAWLVRTRGQWRLHPGPCDS